MVRVEINNFQSIAHQVIEINSFSAIVGRSNIGKSAVVRAVKAALTGSPVDSYVRHSLDCPRVVKGSKSCKCFCSVRITAEDFDLLWEKGDAVNRYVFNNEEHTVAGRGTPEFLGDPFQPVKLGDEKKLVQISDQFDPIFILNKSGTVVADVLSDVAKLDQINSAIRMVNKDKKDANSTRKVREKDVLDLRNTLTRYDGLDEALDRVSSLKAIEEQIEALEGKLEQLSRFIDSARGAAKRVKSLEQVGQVEIPEFEPLSGVVTRYIDAHRMTKELAARQKMLERLDGVDQIQIPKTLEFDDLGDKYYSLYAYATQLKVFKTFFARAKEASQVELPEIESLSESLNNFNKLDGLVRNLLTAQKAASAAKKDFDVISQEADQLSAEFDSLGVCPTCSRPLIEHEEAHA